MDVCLSDGAWEDSASAISVPSEYFVKQVLWAWSVEKAVTTGSPDLAEGLPPLDLLWLVSTG